MASIEQIQSWTISEILGEIQRLLPEGASFVEATKDGWHIATVQQVVLDSSEPKILWSDRGPDRRLTVLNGFGWLWLRNQKPRHPAWKPRQGPEPVRYNPAPFPNIPNFSHLDPAKIRAVYESGAKKKRR